MEAKVAALEEKITTLEVSLHEMQNQNKENQEKIISLLNSNKEKNGEESSHNYESVGTKKKNPELHDEAWDEFR
ncbi:retrotransposon gag protein, partial [Trifolium pratense]